MKTYKEITPQEADALLSLKVPMQMVINGVGDYWSEWEYPDGRNPGCMWRPSEYPQDRFRVEVG